VKYRGIHLHGAHVDTLACVVLLRVLDLPAPAKELAATLRGLAASEDPGNRVAIAQVEAALAEMRSAAGAFARHRAELAGSDDGTAEPAVAAERASSVSPPSGHLTVVGVAERLGVSHEYVRRLCREQVLSATRIGRAWSIEETSIVEYEARRSTAA
jgi:excisionase family DNA binding protein